MWDENENEEVIVDIEEFGDGYPEIPKVISEKIDNVEAIEMQASI